MSDSGLRRSDRTGGCRQSFETSPAFFLANPVRSTRSRLAQVEQEAPWRVRSCKLYSTRAYACGLRLGDPASAGRRERRRTPGCRRPPGARNRWG